MAASVNTPMTQVELTISCKNLRDKDTLSKSDPMVVVFMKDVASGTFREVDRTERIKDSLNPEFAKRISLDYYFEEAQKLKFEVYDVDSNSSKLSAHDFLGRTECTLGEIVGAPGSKVHKALTEGGRSSRQCGSIILSAEELGASKEVALMQFQGSKLDKKDFMGKSDPFLLIYRLNEDNSQTLAFRSEVIKNNLNPVWKPFKVTVRSLCAGNYERPIRIECYDHDNDGGQVHDLIGCCQIPTFKQLLQGQATQNCFELINAKKQGHKKGYKNSGVLQLLKCSVHNEYSFLDYIRGGTEIHFTVAVDFTASNGNPTNPQSLHYIHPYQPNQYMMALKAVGEICQDYSMSKLFPALGFGAKMPNGSVSHEFFLNFHHSDPHCQGVDGILQAYRRSIMSVSLYGPTNFAPVINHVSKFAMAASKDGSHYFVLLIITDGVISDFERTKSAIVNASSLPMSIIIVGVGNDDFEAMEELDSDKYKLTSQGRVAERDIVQFVPFRNYIRGGNSELSQAALSKDVLKEVPYQLTSWMQARNIQPRPPQQINIDQLPPQAAPQEQGTDFTTGGYAPPTDQMQQMNIAGQQPYPAGAQWGQQYPGSAPMGFAPYTYGGQMGGAYGAQVQQAPYGGPIGDGRGQQQPAGPMPGAPYPSQGQYQQGAPYPSGAPMAGAPYPPMGQQQAAGPYPRDGQGAPAPYPAHGGQQPNLPYPGSGQHQGQPPVTAPYSTKPSG